MFKPTTMLGGSGWLCARASARVEGQRRSRARPAMAIPTGDWRDE